MPSPKRKSYPDVYLPATAKELEQSASTLSKLRNTNQSCKTCSKAFQKTPQILICLIKDRRINYYNICIHHTKARKEI